MPQKPCYLPAGESALVVELGSTIDPQIHNRVLALDAATRAAAGGQTDDLVRSRIPAADGGWLILHGSLTDDREQVAIVIERARAPELADIIVSTYGFTAREREVVSLVLQGHSNKRIALTLNRSVKTVEKHRANVMRKLGLHNIADVTRFALQSGLLSQEATCGMLRESAA